MDIRIESITLHNFKGVRDLTVLMEGRNVEIAGRNGAGKSTIFDAFTWLLFGKDHSGQDWTNFDIKPIDPATREAIHHLDHWVEAALTIDGTRRVLRREIAENWVKPRGQAEQVMQGHSQSFCIDGVACSTKRDYDTAVAQWINEDIFKAITNPLHLIDDRYTGWQARRKAVLSLVGDVDTGGISREFADILAEINGTPLDIYRKKITADKKANKARLAEASERIKAWTCALPPEVDLEEGRAEQERITKAMDTAIDKVRKDIAEIDAAVLSANGANKARKAEIDARWKAIRDIEAQQGAIVDAAVEKTRKAHKAEQEKVEQQREALAAAENKVRINTVTLGQEKDYVASLDAKIHAETDALANLGARAQKVTAKAFDEPDTCSVCGQKLPESMMQAKYDEYLERRGKEIAAIKQEGTDIKARIAQYRKTKEESIARALQIEAAIAEAQQEAEQLRAGLGTMQEAPEPDWDAIREEAQSDKLYAELGTQKAAIEMEVEELAGNGTEDTAVLLDRRHALEDEIERLRRETEEQLQPIRAREANNGARFRLMGMIAEEKEREKAYADEVARLERLEIRTGEMVKATIEAQTEAVNALFRVARWKMFDTTLDGNPVEICEVTNADGVPYRSMNDAMKIQCGLDIIRVISEKHNHTAPIFIDNAESVLQTSFDTAAQVIRLVVADTDFSINK